MAENDIERKSNMEQAEGSRETADQNLEEERSGGDTTRPMKKERQNQQRVPNRGDKKDDEPLTRVDI